MQIATVTLNPAYDLVGYCSHITLGEVNLIEPTGLHAAGKGINVAKVLKSLNFDVSVTGFLGQDNRDGFSLLFKQLGLIDQFHTVAGRTRINVKLTEQNSQVTDLNFSGFTVNDQNWQDFKRTSLAWLTKMDLVVVSGSLPAGIPLEQFTKWLCELKAHIPNLIFDSSRAALAAGLDARPWLIKPNERELELLVKRPLPTISDIIDAAKTVIEQGIANVVVSLGSQGALWVSEHAIWQAIAPKQNVVSTVGAGDSMVAGLVYGILNQLPMDKTLAFASAVASLSVTQTSVGGTDIEQINRLLPEVKLRAL